MCQVKAKRSVILALRSGNLGVFPDGVSYPVSGEEVRVLLDYARQIKAVVIPYGVAPASWAILLQKEMGTLS